jgi:hypothetical protein
MKQESSPLPATIQGRLVLVGKVPYSKEFKTRLAGLGISRNILFELLRGRGKRRDIDGEFIELLESERQIAAARASEIDALSKRFRREVLR